MVPDADMKPVLHAEVIRERIGSSQRGRCLRALRALGLQLRDEFGGDRDGLEVRIRLHVRRGFGVDRKPRAQRAARQNQGRGQGDADHSPGLDESGRPDSTIHAAVTSKRL